MVNPSKSCRQRPVKGFSFDPETLLVGTKECSSRPSDSMPSSPLRVRT